jgi:dipeptidyl aminopeptidase/acylaminoacyl peptidase
LNAKGLIDTAQMGVMGWSNGAILTTMLTVRYPDMFKVAAPGAGDVNWTSDYGTCEFGVQFDQSYFQVPG